MKVLNKVLGLLAGSIGALLSGCGDSLDDVSEGPVYYGPAPDDQAVICCQNLVDAEQFDACIENYRKTNDCDQASNPYQDAPPIAYYGPAPIDDEVNACCGDDDGSDEWTECAGDYIKNQACSASSEPSKPDPTVYGPAPGDDLPEAPQP